MSESLIAARWVGALLLAAGIGLYAAGSAIGPEALHIVLMFAGVLLGVAGLRRIFDPSGCGT